MEPFYATLNSKTGKEINAMPVNITETGILRTNSVSIHHQLSIELQLGWNCTSPKMVPLVPVRCLAILSSRYFVQRIDHVKVFNNNVTVCVWLIGRGATRRIKLRLITKTWMVELMYLKKHLVNVMLVLCLCFVVSPPSLRAWYNRSVIQSNEP